MNQAFDARVEFDEGTKLHQPRDRAAHSIADLVLTGNRVPRMRLKLLQADRDALLATFSGELKYLYFDLLSHRKNIGRLIHASPGDIADVQQGIDSAEINEGTVISQAAHRGCNGVPLFDLPIEAIFRSTLLFLGDGPAIYDHVFVRHIELDDAAADLLAQ